MDEQDCEVCGQPGEPSWGGVVLCESCYGTVGATCSGLPRGQKPRKDDQEAVC